MPQQPVKPLTKNQVMELVKAGMEDAQIERLVREHGIDFEPTDDDVQALQKAGASDAIIEALHAAKPSPLTKDQVSQLVAGGVPRDRIVALVKQRGVDFLADEEFLDPLRQAGADDAVIAALRAASDAVRTELVVTTSPSAEVFLDGNLQGQANAQGELTLQAKLGAHALKVTLTGKKDFEQSVAITNRQAVKIVAQLVDAPGSVRLQAQAGASISLDGAGRGSTDASGELVLGDLSPGIHQLRVTAPGKKEFQQSVTVSPGQETRVEAQLVDLPGSVRVQSLAGAGISLDGAARGNVDATGELVVAVLSPGAHRLQVTAPGKKEYHQSVMVAPGQETLVEAQLVDLPGSIRVQTLAGARISLDGASRGSADATGKLVLDNLNPGAHRLRLTAPGKKEYQENVTVTAGQETRVEAILQNAPPVPGQVRENSKDGLKYVWIPPGTFTMGCSAGDTECYDDEKPSHRVTLSKGFWIGQTEVTHAAYNRFATQTGRKMPTLKPAWALDHLPIVDMKWDDAHSYCQWAGGRLLTEAEWEYAARAGSSDARYGPIDDIAWYAKNSAGQMHEVAQRHANKFGLFDMLGNEWEWVNDWYGQNYYQNSPALDPTGPASGQERVARGGSWIRPPRTVRASVRSGSNPNSEKEGGDSGFRCGGEMFPL